MDDQIIDLICREKRIMPHVHLSIQSGDKYDFKTNEKTPLQMMCDKGEVIQARKKRLQSII